MKKIALGIVVALLSTTAFAATTAIVKKQNQVANYYKKVANNKATSKNKAKVHVNDLNKYIAQLQNQKKKLVKIKNGSKSNPYAKYNGVWELTTGSTKLYCDDANRTVLPVEMSVSRVRIATKSNGLVKTTPLEVNQIPGDSYVSGTEKITIAANGNIRIKGTQTRYSQTDGYYDQAYDYKGRFTSNVRFSGTEKMSFYYQSYGATCTGSFKLTGNKVGK